MKAGKVSAAASVLFLKTAFSNDTLTIGSYTQTTIKLKETATMKKTSVIICSLILACVLAAATFFTLATPAEKDTIGSQKALEIALQDAGIKAADAKDSKSVFTKKNQTQVFDVEFEFGKNDYDYIIDAKSGDIISRSIEVDDEKNEPLTTAPLSTERTTVEAATSATTLTEHQTVSESKPSTTATEPASKATEPAATTEKQTSAFITAAKAKDIALKDAGVKKSDAVFRKVKLDKDDGTFEYEIEFCVGTTEYEYSVNARTGAVIEKDIDKPGSTKEHVSQAPTTSRPPEPSATFISIDKAKKIALSHAGLSENEVRFEKVKLDKDDGIYEYEVEFYAGGREYDYSINAKTGKIIDFEIEKDN